MYLTDIAQFYEGKLEPRYGLFKDAFFHPASMPKGSIPLGIKFADLLTPNPRTSFLKQYLIRSLFCSESCSINAQGMKRRRISRMPRMPRNLSPLSICWSWVKYLT